MDRHFLYVITAPDAGKSLGEFLREHGYSRRLLARLKRTPQAVRKNGVATQTGIPLAAGDRLDILLPEEKPSDKIEPVPLPFTVVYEDRDILVIDKPADMPVHPSPGNYGNTLANAVAAHALKRGESCVFRCINRLDRDTTGLLILAKHALSGAILSAAMKRRAIRRTYLAVVQGCPEPKDGQIDAPIGRAPGSCIQRQVDFLHGERAVTHYRTVSAGPVYSLIELHLDTGRTHQIRVHMAHIGCPLPGDFLYNPDFSHINRQPLHAAALDFDHPVTGDPLHFETALPADMKKLLEMQPFHTARLFTGGS